MADDRLDGVSSLVPAPLAWFHALLALVGQVYYRVAYFLVCTFVAPVTAGMLRCPASDAGCLLQRTLEGVAVIGVAMNGLHADDPVVF